jgi:hypothetical protein
VKGKAIAANAVFVAPVAKHDLIKAVSQSTINRTWAARTFEITSLPKPCKLFTFKLYINHKPSLRMSNVRLPVNCKGHGSNVEQDFTP